ncbi:MAG: isocitrate lyase/PEP mutase family protein, partial [Alphaproteobacteria bacterium]
GSVFDPMSARIAQDIGFEIGMLAGSTGSLTVLGAPDLIVLTLTEFAEQALRINRAAEIPLMVDADHGYGNALSVMRTVQELETAGVSGMSIEDTELPQPYGEAKQRLLSLEEGVGKMKAAMAAKQDPSLTIAGRTSAVAIAGLDEGIKRAQAYEAAGVDALFMVGVTTRDEVDAISAATTLPLILGGTPAALQDLDYLSSRRVRIALQGHQPIMAAQQAIYNTLKALRDGVKPSALTGLPSKELMTVATRSDRYDEWSKDFLDT